VKSLVGVKSYKTENLLAHLKLVLYTCVVHIGAYVPGASYEPEARYVIKGKVHVTPK